VVGEARRGALLAGREPLTSTEPAGGREGHPRPTEPVTVQPAPEPASAGRLPAPRRNQHRYAIMLTTAVVVYALDHISKWLVSSHVVLDTQVPAGWPVTIHYIQNSGAAFGLFPQFDFLYLVVAAIVAGYILLFGPSMGGGMLRLLALGCILGGSIPNGVDRLVQGYVVDFIDFHFWLFQIFNVADMGIVGGMLVIVYQLGIRHDSVASG